MVVAELAEVSFAYYLGELAVMSIVPVTGLILLIVGCRQQSRARRPPSGDLPSWPDQPGPAPAPRPARSSVVLIIVGSLLLGGGLLVILDSTADLGKQARSTPKPPGVGDCIGAYNFRQHNNSPVAQDCTEPDSIFEVVAKGGASSNCPDGKTEDSDYAFLRDGSTTLCFELNFVQGRCYTASGTARAPLFTATDCDGPGPRFKVANRVDGSSDIHRCPLGAKAIAYNSPARLYCLQPLTN